MAMDENEQPRSQEEMANSFDANAFGSMPANNESAMGSPELENLFLAADSQSGTESTIPSFTSLGTEAFEQSEQFTYPITDYSSSMEHQLSMENVNGGSDALDELYERIRSLETTLSKLERLEQRILLLESTNAECTNELSMVVQQLKAISSQVGALKKGINNTPLYDAHGKFICSGCGSKGDVAAVVRCTKCGRERWVGWWP